MGMNHNTCHSMLHTHSYDDYVFACSILPLLCHLRHMFVSCKYMSDTSTLMHLFLFFFVITTETV